MESIYTQVYSVKLIEMLILNDIYFPREASSQDIFLLSR